MKKNKQNKKQKIKNKKLFNKVIKQIEFDNSCNCYFCLKKTNNKSSYNKINLICFESENNKMKYNEVVKELINKFCPEECSICFESTNNKTICGHIVCLSCEYKIDKCAICRRDLIKRIPISLSWHDVVESVSIEYDDQNGIHQVYSVSQSDIHGLPLQSEFFRIIRVR